MSRQKHNDFSLLVKFYTYIRPYRKWLWIAMAAIPVTTGATVLIPWLLVKIVDDYIVVGNLQGLYKMTFFLAGSVLLSYLADGMYTYNLQKAGLLSIAEMRKALFSHTISLPRTYFDQHPIGVTLSRLTSDTEAMGESIAVGVLALITDIFKTITLLGFLFYLSWKLTLLILIIIPIVSLVVSVIRKRLRYYYTAAREALAVATGYLQESLNGIKTIQLYVAEKRVQKSFKEKNYRFLDAQTRSNTYDALLFSIIDGLTSVTMAVIIWYGTGQILQEVITIGVLIGFINTLSRIFIPIREFAQQIALIQRALAALEHIFELFQEPPERTALPFTSSQQEQLTPFSELCFRDVSFRYDQTGPTVLDHISFTLKKGEKLALVGTTGSGKSSILRLITKNYGDYQGSITINGIELSDIPKPLLNQVVSMMQQDVYLFNESLGFNISLEREEITPEQVWQAVEYVHAHDFINSIPEKLDYQIIDYGRNLSSGQAQLISFARAIAGQSELVLLDEATSSVDSVTEAAIQKAIEKIFSEKTVIAVAHRLSTIRNSDHILVINRGEIVESGNHESLLEQNGYYVKLLQSMDHTLD